MVPKISKLLLKVDYRDMLVVLGMDLEIESVTAGKLKIYDHILKIFQLFILSIYFISLSVENLHSYPF